MEELKATQSRKKVKDQLPSKIGGYKPIQALNSGAMGSLWLCRDPSLDRLVVAKRLNANLNQQDIYIKRFLQEGSILAHLNHPNILQPYALWKDSDGNYTMSMEYIQGSSLKDLLLRNKRPPIWVVETILYDLLSALSHAHRNGVTHRDLKPANMMIDKDGRLRLLDFGIAHTETPLEIGKELTQTGCIIGTAAYMSPEQIMGEKVNYASDLFSVGIIASEMLIGENLFRGKDFEETRENILKMKFKLEVFPDDVPKPLRKFVLKLLNKRASKRPSSACDAANELADLMHEFPRDMTPYIAEWADAVNEDQPTDSIISPNPQKTTFKYGIGFVLGALVATMVFLAIKLMV